MNLAGFVALCLVFPDGLAPGRRWRIVCAAVACGMLFREGRTSGRCLREVEQLEHLVNHGEAQRH
jgi:hypothetical protein